MVKIPKIALNNGSSIPAIGLGTWRAKAGEVTIAVKHAIDCGLRHFDCAMLYENEAEVGNAIREKIAEGVIKREDVFVTSKLWCNAMRPERVERTIRKSLEHFGLDYLDLYLIHWPVAFQEGANFYPMEDNGKVKFTDVDYVDTWKAMEAVQKKGLTKAIGVSNFNIKQLERVLKVAEIKPAVNQVEYHPYLNQRDLLQFCKSHGIVVVAYSPLGSNDRPWATTSDPLLLEDAHIKRIAHKYNKRPAQIILRYLVQLGVAPIPKSTNQKRIEENINIFDFELAPEDTNIIDTFDAKIRYHEHLEYVCKIALTPLEVKKKYIQKMPLKA